MITSPSDICLVSSDIYFFVDKFVEFTNKDIDVQPLHKLVILLGFLFVFIIKVMKPLHNISEVNTTWFATYPPHYKEKLGTKKFIYNPFFFSHFLS